MLGREFKTIAVIPARMGSTRLPGKPLLKVGGKPIIQHVWENCVSSRIDFKIIATDDERIVEAVKGFGGRVMMTSLHHKNGSERCVEVVETYPKYDIVLNIQGDEPMVNQGVIDGLLAPFVKYPESRVTTLKTPVSTEEAGSPHVVKVVTDKVGRALYFSRSLIPYNRDQKSFTYHKHLGFYAFRRECLLEYVKLPPSPLENAERLEQLRLLESGYPIYVSDFSGELIDINTEEDLKRFEERLG